MTFMLKFEYIWLLLLMPDYAPRTQIATLQNMILSSYSKKSDYYHGSFINHYNQLVLSYVD